MVKKLVIGIDQSYTKTGISIAINGKLKKVTSNGFKGLKTRSKKRNELRRVLTALLKQSKERGYETVILCERIRTFNQAQKGRGLNPAYMQMTGALVATIVDTAADFNVEVYSVDTRAWKSKVVGNSKARKTKDGKRDAKGETVKFIINKGFDLFIRTDRNGNDIYDDDAADSACIALYGFIPKTQQRLKLEE
jgi:hypothetical protein